MDILKNMNKLELSTQILIKEALKRKIEVELLDVKENFIMLRKDSKIEYVKQATKTSLDSYITYLIMENKGVSKRILKQAGISVPEGEEITDLKGAENLFEKYKDQPIVIKPKSTNFGIGINILNYKFTGKDFKAALEGAFKYDDSILIEKFIKGLEYRFLVIGDRSVAVLHRRAANVKGDGIHSVKELIIEKNKNPLRGSGYKKPLEKIRHGKEEEDFLASQGKDFNYVPAKDEIVYLRSASNISTGGDSLDFTDIAANRFKEIAVKAAQSVNAKICGVDLIVEDIKSESADQAYAVIEINFNPALHIHDFPAEGKTRETGKAVLDLLGF